jgi:ElaB/YqjD/DUF883 family membrane-anchored ribosome-binding protein
MSELTAAQRDKLVADLRVVVSDAEELLKLTAGDVSAATTELRTRLQERLMQARHGLAELQGTAAETARATARVADDFVHEHPWRSVAIGAGVGLIVGLLIGRR